MSQTFTFERPFRLKILALLLDRYWCARFGSALIKPEYFEQEDEEIIARCILDYHSTYSKPPIDPEDIIAMIGKPEFANAVYKVFDIHEAGDTDLAGDTVIQFAREQAVKLAILESIDEVNQGKLSAPMERLDEALKVGQSLLSPGIDPIMDVDAWLFNYWDDKIPTGITHLDKVMDGGLAGGEFGVWMAPPNRGKSLSLINTGFAAAALGSGKNVVHFSHEMKAEQVAKRYAARLLFRFPNPNENLDEYADNLIDCASKLLPGKIRIIYTQGCTVEELDAKIDQLNMEGFNTGMIIDDYPDLLKPSHRFNERRFELSEIYRDCRDLAGLHNVPFWGASQSGRDSLSKEIITMADIAEDIGKANIADVILALCQTYDEERTDLARIFIAKLRDGSTAWKAKSLIRCKYFGQCQALVSTGYVDPKEKEERKNVGDR